MLALAGCAAMPVPVAVSPPPVARPAPPEPVVVPDPADSAIGRYFARLETDRRARGLMRTDDGETDAPITAATLEENFVRIALYDEYTRVGSRLVERATPSRLRRFEAPVRIALHFGEAVPPVMAAADRAFVGRYADRLARATNHPVSLGATPSGANFHVLVLTEAERVASTDRLRALIPELDDATLRLVIDMPLSISCLALALGEPETGVYRRAIAVIRAELPELSRHSCYHEEIAQGLGLANDSRTARPSLFNDSQEFALLTRHDELLLRILYDRRLRPGLREAEARPILRNIIAGLMAPET